MGLLEKNTYICDVINPAYAGVLTHKGISDPTEMPFAVLKGADGVKLHPSKCLLQVSTILMIKTVCISVNFDLEFEAPRLVKVKAHWRLLNGKKVKVRSHYRRIWVCR